MSRLLRIVKTSDCYTPYFLTYYNLVMVIIFL
nr:MAG TPA: hypothetical protein [Caudoviricetes sp.]